MGQFNFGPAKSQDIPNKLDTASVVNNLTTTDEGYALDARQGKVLSEQMANMQAQIPTPIRFVKQSNGSFGGFIGAGETWVFFAKAKTAGACGMYIFGQHDSVIDGGPLFQSTGMDYLSNNYGTVTIRYNAGSGADSNNVDACAMRIK